jgi:HAE1 family hydrophobic/amphiphilic exporter-1
MLSVPLGLVGSILGLWVTGNTINMYSIIGLIMAFGLVAKSGILLIDFTNTLRAQGLGRTEALAEAARIRLRPIIMTSCTMAFGMLPLALKAEEGAESRAPMAVVVIGAIITSTILALFVIPAVYTLFDDLSGVTARLHVRRPKLALPRRAIPIPVPVGTIGHPATNGNGHAGLPAPAVQPTNGATGTPSHGAGVVEPRLGMPEP